jgi:iron complex outermembrane recepter protein
MWKLFSLVSPGGSLLGSRMQGGCVFDDPDARASIRIEPYPRRDRQAQDIYYSTSSRLGASVPNPTTRSRWKWLVLATLILSRIASSLLQPGAALAQEQESEETPSEFEGVEEMIVVGTAGAGSLLDEAMSATSFSASDLTGMGVAEISDLDRFTPGLEINTLSATTPTFFIRGVGLNDFAANAPGAIAVYRDRVPINAPAIQLGLLFDIENVDVLRGPQSWDADRNASGGAIKIRHRKPSGEVEARLQATHGNFGLLDYEGALGVPVVEDMLSARVSFRLRERDPITENRCRHYSPAPGLPATTPVPPFSERLANLEEFGGVSFCGERANRFFQNPNPPPGRLGLSPLPSGLPSRVNDIGTWAARGQLRLHPSEWAEWLPWDSADWLLSLHGGKIDQYSAQGQVVGTGFTANGQYGDVTRTGYLDPDFGTTDRNALIAMGPAVAKDIDLVDPFKNDYDSGGKERLDTVGGLLSGDMEFGDVGLTLIGGVERYERARLNNFDSTPDPQLILDISDDSWQFTGEARVSGELESEQISWNAGAYYLGERLDSDAGFTLAQGSIVQFLVLQDYEQDIDSFGIYANASWDFLDSFTLDGGARFNFESKTFELGVSRCFLPNFVCNEGSPQSTDEIWSDPTGGLTLTYHFDESQSVYLKYSRGWKGGHFNAAVTEVTQAARGSINSADPETIDSFEAGLHGSWFDGVATLDASLFLYNYKDYQVFIVLNRANSIPQLQVVNANDAQVYGGELELVLNPLLGLVPEDFEGLSLTTRFGWLESEFIDFTTEQTAQLGNISRSLTIDHTGNRLPNSPRFKLSATAEYTIQLGRLGFLVPRYDVSFTDDVNFDQTNGRGQPAINALQEPAKSGRFPQHAIGQRAYWLHDVALSYRTPDELIQVTGWVRNVADEIYKTYVVDLDRAFGSTVNYVGDPRTYGLNVEFKF